MILCELPTIQFSPPLGEVTVMVATGAGLPRQPLTKAGKNPSPVAEGTNSMLELEPPDAGHWVLSTGTY